MHQEDQVVSKNITFTHREEVSRSTLFFEYFVLVLVFLILIPAGVLFVTKDSLPGEPLYTYKIQLESAASSLFSATPVSVTFEKMILGRRFSEGTERFKAGSSDAFDAFLKKMNEVSNLILNETDKSKRTRDSLDYIKRLNGYSSTIESLAVGQVKGAISVSVRSEIDKVIKRLDEEGVKGN